MIIKVLPANAALLSVNEKVEMEAQKTFYNKIGSEMGNKISRRLRFGLGAVVPLFEQKKREYFFFLFFGRRKKKKKYLNFQILRTKYFFSSSSRRKKKKKNIL